MTTRRGLEAPVATSSAWPSRQSVASRAHWSSAGGGFFALICVMAPMLLAGGAIAVSKPNALLDGDQAVDEMALMRSAHFAQLVGNYSRFGWNHPGPSWFYAMDPVYLGLGSQSWSFYVAFLTFHAVVAALIVAAVWRRGGALLALISSGLLLLYVRAVGESIFRILWPPFVPILPMVLFFILAASGASGSTPAMVGALIAGSFAVQTHVSTTPVVLGVLGVMVALRVGIAVLGRRDAEQRPVSRMTVPLTAGGLVLFVVMWVPVVVDQLTGRPGNLTKLGQFFSTPQGRHPYHEAISSLGRLLEVYPFGKIPFLLETNFSTVGPDRLLAIAVFLAAAAGLALAGTLLRDRFAQALAVLLLVAMPITVISMSRIAGPMHPYIVIWVTAFPLILAIGWAALLVRLPVWSRWRTPATPWLSRVVALGLTVVVVALAAGRFQGFQQIPSPATEQSVPDTHAAWALVDTALAGEQPQPLLVDITGDRWAVAAGLMLPLDKRGWTLTVNREAVFVFGESTRSTGHERLELVVANSATVQQVEHDMPDLQPIGHTQDTYLFLRRLPRGVVKQ